MGGDGGKCMEGKEGGRGISKRMMLFVRGGWVMGRIVEEVGGASQILSCFES